MSVDEEETSPKVVGRPWVLNKLTLSYPGPGSYELPSSFSPPKAKPQLDTKERSQRQVNSLAMSSSACQWALPGPGTYTAERDNQGASVTLSSKLMDHQRRSPKQPKAEDKEWGTPLLRTLRTIRTTCIGPGIYSPNPIDTCPTRSAVIAPLPQPPDDLHPRPPPQPVPGPGAYNVPSAFVRPRRRQPSSPNRHPEPPADTNGGTASFERSRRKVDLPGVGVSPASYSPRKAPSGPTGAHFSRAPTGRLPESDSPRKAGTKGSPDGHGATPRSRPLVPPPGPCSYNPALPPVTIGTKFGTAI
eukprot:TRINITY_DN14063_c0_g1_i1.p1 TRINITY_DN14063_c0_g1~~TRINITY_DN14063_c0_g1_i1.p1  ORF type:complete len:310 (+),score=11.20 TRINITY_DN14063_c0_g1_i1:26-931(+)